MEPPPTGVDSQVETVMVDGGGDGGQELGGSVGHELGGGGAAVSARAMLAPAASSLTQRNID